MAVGILHANTDEHSLGGQAQEGVFFQNLEYGIISDNEVFGAVPCCSSYKLLNS